MRMTSWSELLDLWLAEEGLSLVAWKKIAINSSYSMSSFPGGAMVKNLPANSVDKRDIGLIPGSGRSPGERNSNPLQYSYLENPMDRGTWLAAVHAVTKESDTTELASEVQLQQQYSKHLTMVACVSQGNSLSLSPFLPVSPLFPSLSHCYNLKRKKEF